VMHEAPVSIVSIFSSASVTDTRKADINRRTEAATHRLLSISPFFMIENYNIFSSSITTEMVAQW